MFVCACVCIPKYELFVMYHCIDKNATYWFVFKTMPIVSCGWLLPPGIFLVHFLFFFFFFNVSLLLF